MTWTLGETVRESFQTGVAGETFTAVTTRINGATVPFGMTFTDLGSGFYEYNYTPSAIGSYAWMGNGSISGPLTINFEVEPAPAATTSTSTISTTNLIATGGSWLVGETVTEGFHTGTPGETFTILESHDPNGLSFLTAANFTEVGTAGDYFVSFLASTAGHYYGSWITSLSSTIEDGNWDVEGAATVLGTPVTVTQGASRKDLRRRIGGPDGLGDFMLLTATAGTDSQITDENRLFLPSNGYKGREIYVATGPNAGQTRKVIGNNQATRTLDFTPSLSSTLTPGIEVELWNKDGNGWHSWEVDEVINGIIADARSGFWIPQIASIVNAFDATSPTIALPATLSKVFAVEWQDSYGYWHDEGPSDYAGGNGWYVEGGASRLIVGGPARTNMANKTVRVKGYGDLPLLATDTDVTPLNAEWLVKEATARLLLAGLDRQTINQVRYPAAQRRADQARPIAQGRPQPNTVLVGAA